MEYVIIILLVILIVLVIISISKNINESNITERLGRVETNTIKELGEFKSSLSRDMNEDFTKLNTSMEEKLRLINDRVNERLDQNFEKTNKTFTSVLERLSKIDEAQKKIDNLSNDIVSLQGVLTDKKSRGIFGEINLKNIMVNVFGENNEKIYKMQYSFDNSTMADCVLFAPEPLGTIAIDSKFPLENYQVMIDRKNSPEVRTQAEKLFKSDMKKHIDAIASKYIIPDVTAEQAILFLPAEAIFAEVNAYHTDIIQYAYRKKVWITSPTTLISTLTTIQIILKNVERDKNANIIRKELNLLSEDFKRYKDRWDKLYRSIETVSKDVKDIHTTTNKITNRFESISSGEMQKIEYEED
jgi:DNA recombination protein RmuC